MTRTWSQQTTARTPRRSVVALWLSASLALGCREPMPTEEPVGTLLDGPGTTASLELPLLPANGKIAFAEQVPDGGLGPGDNELFSMNPGGTGRIRLTDNDLEERFPAWSPDGTKLAYVVVGSKPPTCGS
ncbi:MAG TPA: hypothetical protein VEB59_10335 [Gemmatimonadales bacterium]|nr:hypothetical protein [Gemmatimonadales bacterium]